MASRFRTGLPNDWGEPATWGSSDYCLPIPLLTTPRFPPTVYCILSIVYYSDF